MRALTHQYVPCLKRTRTRARVARLHLPRRRRALRRGRVALAVAADGDGARLVLRAAAAPEGVADLIGRGWGRERADRGRNKRRVRK